MVVLSGGDDCAVKGWDLRLGTDRPAFAASRVHTGGEEKRLSLCEP
jgi:hypothetical protein